MTPDSLTKNTNIKRREYSVVKRIVSNDLLGRKGVVRRPDGHS